MRKTIRVTTTAATVLRHAVELATKRTGEDVWDRQARTLDELGYVVVSQDRSEAVRLVEGIREVLAGLSGAACSFWACPGADHPSVAMATCNVCAPQQELRKLLGDPKPVCTALECSTCGRESPWCEECDEKLVDCQHVPPDQP